MPDTKKKWPAVQPHDKFITKVTDNVYTVHGCFQFKGPIRFGLCMTLYKNDDGEITIMNSNRVSKKVEDEIRKLGTVKHVCRIVSNHGRADEYYVETFGATYWDIPGAQEHPKSSTVPATTNILEVGGPLPGIPDSKLMLLDNLSQPDGMVLLKDGGGIIVGGDFIQNGRGSKHDSFIFKKVIGPVSGIKTHALTTPPTYQEFYGKGEDMSVNCPVILALEFDTIICAHGSSVVGGAKEDLRKGWALINTGKIKGIGENWSGKN